MARSKSTAITESIASVLPAAKIEAEARRLGVVRRQRKVDVFALVCTLVLAFQAGAERTLNGLREAYEQRTGDTLVRSAFNKRLSAQLASLLRSLALAALESAAATGGAPSGILAGFKDLLAIDSTVLRLHRLLESKFRACRTNHTKAAAKLHMVMSVLQGTPRHVKLTPERTNDRTPWRRVGAWVKGMLLLFDLGYYSHHLFSMIDANGGFFLTRLKVNANPLIVAVHRRWRGQSVPVVGRRLRDVLRDLQRQVLDVEVEVSFERRAYRGKRSKATQTFRLVAIRNAETKTYHCYLTNVAVDVMPAEDVTATYALRWQVEILFKAMKHHGHLDHLPSSKQSVVECLIWASVLSMMVSRALFDEIRKAVPADRAMPQLRWASLFARVAQDVLELMLQPTHRLASRILAVLLHDAPDPNRRRQGRAMDGLVAWNPP